MAPKFNVTARSVEFPITSVRAGKKMWFAGVCGEQVTLVDDLFGIRTSKHQKEVSIVGEACNGEYLAFEVHKVDYSPAIIRKLLQKKEEGELSAINVTNGDESSDDIEKAQIVQKDESIGMTQAFQAYDLAPRRSIRVKFKDIMRVETHGDSMTLTLGHAPQCYAKRSGKPRSAKQEPVQDFTGGARTITFKCHRSSEVHSILKYQSPRLENLFRVRAPPSVPAAVTDVATPSKKRDRESDHLGDSMTKQPRQRSNALSRVRAMQGA